MINIKKRMRPKPIVGSLLDFKTANQTRIISWKNVSNGKAPVPKSIEEVDFKNYFRNFNNSLI